jgi:hypothetical protein
MGVIYKLTPAVVEFIVQHKRDIPKLSCRQLCKIASDKFQIPVSKSSVNNVLKGAGLSSSVGRRGSGKPKPKPFEIPRDKKDLLLHNVQKTVAADEITFDAATPQIERSAKPVTSPIQAELPKSLSREEFERSVEAIRARKNQPREAIYMGAGAVFLKAALERLGGIQALARIFEKHLVALPQEFPQILEALIYLTAVDRDASSNLDQYAKHAAWPLSGLTGPLEEGLISGWLRDVQNMPTLVFEYETLKQQTFLQAGSLKVVLSDGRFIALDAQMSTVWSSQIPSEFCWPFEKAVSGISATLISNNEFIILARASEHSTISEEFLGFIASLDNSRAAQIERIMVFSPSGEVLSEFAAIPQKKRFFIVPIWARQVEFSLFVKSAKWAAKSAYYHELSDQPVFWVETKSDLLTALSGGRIEEARAITLWSLTSEEPVVVLLTNDKATQAVEIVKAFLNRRRLDEAQDLIEGVGRRFDVGGNLSGGAELKTLQSLLWDFANQLMRDTQRCWFGASKIAPEQIIVSLNQLEGRIVRSDKVLACSLFAVLGDWEPFLSAAKAAVYRDFIKEGGYNRVVVY